MGELPRLVNLATSRLGAGEVVQQSDRFRFSRLAVLVELPAGETGASSESDSEEEAASPSRNSGAPAVGRKCFALHGNFGNEEVSSWLRVRLAAPPSADFAVSFLVQRQHLS